MFVFSKKLKKKNFFLKKSHLAIPERSNERVWKTTLSCEGLFWTWGPGSVPRGGSESDLQTA